MCTGSQREIKKTIEITETISKYGSHLQQQQVHFCSSNRSYNTTKDKVRRLQKSLVTQLPESLKILSHHYTKHQQNKQLVLLYLSMLVSHLWVPPSNILESTKVFTHITVYRLQDLDYLLFSYVRSNIAGLLSMEIFLFVMLDFSQLYGSIIAS